MKYRVKMIFKSGQTEYRTFDTRKGDDPAQIFLKDFKKAYGKQGATAKVVPLVKKRGMKKPAEFLRKRWFK